MLSAGSTTTLSRSPPRFSTTKTLTPEDRILAHYALAVALTFAGRPGEAVHAADQCFADATSIRSAGWQSNALATRAQILAAEGDVDGAVSDLVEAEVLLENCPDPGLRNWAHSAMGSRVRLAPALRAGAPPLRARAEDRRTAGQSQRGTDDRHLQPGGPPPALGRRARARRPRPRPPARRAQPPPPGRPSVDRRGRADRAPRRRRP